MAVQIRVHVIKIPHTGIHVLVSDRKFRLGDLMREEFLPYDVVGSHTQEISSIRRRRIAPERVKASCATKSDDPLTRSLHTQ
jgi:hypothetical protein